MQATDRTDTAPAWRARLLFGALMAAVALLELALCFAGPLAFTRKPQLVLFPPFTSQFSDREVAELADFLERELALSNSYRVESRGFIEERSIRVKGAFDRSRLKPANYDEAHAVARELGLERFAIASLYSYSRGCELSVTIRDVATGEIVQSGYFASPSMAELLEGRGSDGKELKIHEALATTTRGIGLTDVLVLALLALQLLLGVLTACGREPRALAEIVWAGALILFVFAFIFAKSANMDYVQRFIATKGQLRLARSTALEQLYAAARFAPLLLLDAGFIVWSVLASARGPADRRGEEAGSPHWVTRVFTRWAPFWVVLAAALYGLSFPSFLRLDGIAPLAWFSMVPLFLVLVTVRPAMGLFYGVLFGTLQALVINYWHGTYDYVTLHMITIVFAVEYLVFMGALVLLIKASGKWGFLVVPAAWTLFDYLRSSGVTGYPWGLIGTSQYRFLPFIQTASLTGVWGLGFVVVLVNAGLAWTLAAPVRAWSWRWPWSTRRPRASAGCLRASAERLRCLAPAGVSGAVLGLCLIVGLVILHQVEQRLYGTRGTPKATIILLQQNTDPRRHEYRENFLKIVELTRQAAATLDSPPDLVVWPEGGFKLDLRYWGRVVQEFNDFQRSLGSWLLTGTQDHGTETTASGEPRQVNYNSSVLVDSEGRIRQFYHKIHLVPFSEYFPLDQERFPKLYSMFETFEISNWGVGGERVVFEHDKMRFFTPICFEDVFSDHARRFVLQGVDVIINMSNDYWSLSPVEGRQHGVLALFRAVENQRPILRATSSGYTVYVDAAGRIQPGAPQPYTEGWAVARVPLPERRLTLYTRWGDWFPLACAGLLPVLLALGVAHRRRERILQLRRTARNIAAARQTGFALDGEPAAYPRPLLEPVRASTPQSASPVGWPAFPEATRPCSLRRSRP